jgi:acetyltransferase-like isoleucine patch superfamily enzyme
MVTSHSASTEQGQSRFTGFLKKDCPDRLFRYPTSHPSRPTGFCPCDEGGIRAAWFYAKATLLNVILALPFNSISVWILRTMGATVGRNVYISAGVWIDPMFPQLLTIEDDVLLGVGARIAFHEFRTNEFVAGRVHLGRGSLIGGFSLIGPGVRVGDGATVAGGAVIARDVPPGSIAGGNPARAVSS